MVMKCRDQGDVPFFRSRICAEKLKSMCSLYLNYPILTPISLPIPKVIAAAASQKNTCLAPEYQTFLPVNRVIAPPIRKSHIELDMVLRIMAFSPVVNINGNTGIIAPIPKRINE